MGKVCNCFVERVEIKLKNPHSVQLSPGLHGLVNLHDGSLIQFSDAIKFEINNHILQLKAIQNSFEKEVGLLGSKTANSSGGGSGKSHNSLTNWLTHHHKNQNNGNRA